MLMDKKLDELKIENQNLREILEVSKQITSGLDSDYIIKNAVLSIYSKFNPTIIGFILPKDIDDFTPDFYFFRSNIKIDVEIDISNLELFFEFFQDKEFNQISFKDFARTFPDKSIVLSFQQLNIDFIIPIKSQKGIIGIYFQGKSDTGRLYSMENIQFCVNILSFVSISLENATLFREATVDRMTKLYTHHQFMKKLAEEIEKCRRYGNSFSLIMFDIDKFKSFNDNYGHLQGDVIIIEIAKILLSSIRISDFAARYGGEEFMIILPETNLEKATEFSERLRKTIEEYEFSGENRTFHVTISLGVIEFDKKKVKYNEDILEGVDKALYNSKQNGRNVVSIGYYDREEILKS